jgi:hypothetical protein
MSPVKIANLGQIKKDDKKKLKFSGTISNLSFQTTTITMKRLNLLLYGRIAPEID